MKRTVANLCTLVANLKSLNILQHKKWLVFALNVGKINLSFIGFRYAIF